MTAVPDIKPHPLVCRLMAFYEDFSRDNLSRLDDFYTPDIEFVDPVHRVNGILFLKRYMKNMASNLSHYRMRYMEVLTGENAAYLTWEMDFAHNRIRGGEIITVRGMTHLKFTSRVYYHEDVYDMGALLYEHLPLLGGVTRMLKSRLAVQEK